MSGDLAQSIVSTGRDLDGNRYPLFPAEPTYHPGRDPLLVYATALLLKFRPLSESTVRMPNAMTGVIDVLLMFLVARRIFKSDLTGAIVALMLAISPSHLMHSRLGVSLLLPLPFALLWLYALTEYVETKAVRYLWACAVILGSALYGYLAAVILMPIYLVCTAWVAWPDRLQDGLSRESMRRMGVLVAGFVIPILPIVIYQLLHRERYGQLIAAYHPYAPRFGPLQGAKELLSYFSLSVRTSNYWTNISPGLLFFDSDPSLINSTRAAGVFLWPMVFFFAAGVYRILTARRSRFSLVLLIGLLTAPLPQVLTVDVGIRRSLVMVVFGTLIAGYGVEFLLAQRRIAYRAVVAALLIALTVSFTTFYRDYSGDYQQRAAYWFGNNIRGMYDDLMALRPSGSNGSIYLSNTVPYLDEYGMFYTASRHREDLLAMLHYYTPSELDPRAQPAGSLLVAPYAGPPATDRLMASGWAVVKTVSEPTGQPVFVIVEKR